MTKPARVRCAIYTRKSTEEGLDQEFNSLDAQRVAAEAYIQSQIHEGWEVIPTYYDDGGFSGGNLDRPALNELIADIKRGVVDAIIVYKVDRLSRSLSDFSRLVELLEKHNVSFVSVTQAFNTTNSMGRLTLNILLSFAQFEREVTGERIRDKFAASKKKGMWMGGIIPLGYNVIDRKLIVNQEEAKQVRLMFEKYLKFKSVNKLKDYLNVNGYRIKRWELPSGTLRGGTKFTKHSARTVLSNVMYIGKITHKKDIYEGEHEAIIEQKLWDKVQAQLKQNTVDRSALQNQNHDILFKGKLFDAVGNRFITTYSKRGTKRYHYYWNQATNDRISVVELNSIMAYMLTGLSINSVTFSSNILTKAEIEKRYLASINEVIKHAVKKVIMDTNHITVMLNKSKLIDVLEKAENSYVPLLQNSEQPMGVIDKSDSIEIIMQVMLCSYAGKKIAYGAHGKVINIQKTNHDENLVRAIANSYKWNKMLDSGEVKTQKDIAEMESKDREYVGDILKLKYLAPEITTMILNGTQPRTLKLSHLTHQPIPHCWESQKSLLHIS